MSNKYYDDFKTTHTDKLLHAIDVHEYLFGHFYNFLRSMNLEKIVDEDYELGRKAAENERD